MPKLKQLDPSDGPLVLQRCLKLLRPLDPSWRAWVQASLASVPTDSFKEQAKIPWGTDRTPTEKPLPTFAHERINEARESATAAYLRNRGVQEVPAQAVKEQTEQAELPILPEKLVADLAVGRPTIADALESRLHTAETSDEIQDAIGYAQGKYNSIGKAYYDDFFDRASAKNLTFKQKR